MIDNELCPIVAEFMTEMLNDPHCESILLDVDKDVRADSGLPVLYLDVMGKHYDYRLSIAGDKYSGRVQYVHTNYPMMVVEGERGARRFQELLNEFKTRLRGDN